MIGLLISSIAPLLEKVIPDATQRNKLAHDIATMTQKHAHEIAKSQIEVNRAEAAHKSLFVAGWRPAVGWVCVSAMAFNYLAVPVVSMFGLPVQPVDDSSMMTVLLGMLGLGGMRTYEKNKGVSREN